MAEWWCVRVLLQSLSVHILSLILHYPHYYLAYQKNGGLYFKIGPQNWDYCTGPRIPDPCTGLWYPNPWTGLWTPDLRTESLTPDFRQDPRPWLSDRTPVSDPQLMAIVSWQPNSYWRFSAAVCKVQNANLCPFYHLLLKIFYVFKLSIRNQNDTILIKGLLRKILWRSLKNTKVRKLVNCNHERNNWDRL